MNGVELISVLVCEDVLANPSGRLTLYNLFHDLTADSFPATLPRLHVVTTWYNPQEDGSQALIRVVILAPDETLVGDATATVSVGPDACYHTQVSRFRDLVLPGPGTYRVQVARESRIVSDLPLVVLGPGPGGAQAETRGD